MLTMLIFDGNAYSVDGVANRRYINMEVCMRMDAHLSHPCLIIPEHKPLPPTAYSYIVLLMSPAHSKI